MSYVTLNDVAEAIEALERSGEPVNSSSIRTRIGRGSFTTITKHLRKISEEKIRAVDLPCQGDESSPPAEIIEPVVDIMRDAAISAYRSMVRPINRQISDARATVAAEREAMAQNLSLILAEADELKDRIDATQRELLAATAESGELRAWLEMARARANDLENNLRETQSELETARQEITLLRMAAAASESARSTTEGLHAQLILRLDALGSTRMPSLES